jgi:hypothetical protein
MAQVSMNVARTAQRNPAEAAAHLLSQLHGPQPKLAVLFASRDRDQRELNKQIRDKLPSNTRLIGATTGGEIDNAGIHQGQAVLAALSGDFEVGIGLGRGLSTDAMNAGSTAMESACRELDVNVANVDVKSHVGLVIDDGYRYKKEELLLGFPRSTCRISSKNSARSTVRARAAKAVRGSGSPSSKSSPVSSAARSRSRACWEGERALP